MKGVICFVALSALAALAYGVPLPAGLVRTPSGVFPSECVHSIPSGATMERNPGSGRLHVYLADGTLHSILPKCESGPRASLPSDYDGWEAYTAYNDPQNKTFDSFLGYFSVPDKPKEAPQASRPTFFCPCPPLTAHLLLHPLPSIPSGTLHLHWPAELRLDPPPRP